MTKPTNLALWSTTGTKVEPSGGVKAAGWAPDQKPPAQWLNWWMNAVYLWMVWLDAFEATAHTWTATQTVDVSATFQCDGIANFTNDFTFLGAGAFASDVNFVGPVQFQDLVTFNAALTFNAGATFNDPVTLTDTLTVDGLATLSNLDVVGAGGGTSGIPVMRAIANVGTGSKAIAAILRDAADATSMALIVYKALASGLNNPDTTVQTIIAKFYGAILLAGANAGKNVAFLNTVHPLNTLKTYALIHLNGTATPAGTTGAVDGTNLFSITQDLGDASVVVTFAQGMADANYIVDCKCESLPAYVAAISAGEKLTNKVTIRFVDSAGGGGAITTIATLSGTYWNLKIHGRQ